MAKLYGEPRSPEDQSTASAGDAAPYQLLSQRPVGGAWRG